MSNKNRKIFNYDNIDESKIVSMLSKNELFDKSISATGILFYKIVKNNVKLMLIKYADKNWPKLDDFGGRIDNTDDTVFDAAIRETEEETNKIITKDLILKISSDDNIKCFYNKTSKYFLHLIRVDEDFFSDTSIFGDFEEHDKIYRKVEWYDFKDCKTELSYRLQMHELFNFIIKVEN